MKRIRIHYRKFGNLIYTGSLDLQKIWERSFRRAGFSLAYSSGFHPQAHIQQSAPLPLGFFGSDEIVDIWLSSPVEILTLINDLPKYFPEGLEIISIENIDCNSPALQNLIIAAEYEIKASNLDINIINQAIAVFYATPHYMMIKRGKEIDLRFLVESINIDNDKSIGNNIIIQMRLKHLPGATGRPEDVLQAINVSYFESEITRLNLVFR